MQGQNYAYQKKRQEGQRFENKTEKGKTISF